jgi:hypothetical protein
MLIVMPNTALQLLQSEVALSKASSSYGRVMLPRTFVAYATILEQIESDVALVVVVVVVDIELQLLSLAAQYCRCCCGQATTWSLLKKSIISIKRKFTYNRVNKQLDMCVLVTEQTHNMCRLARSPLFSSLFCSTTVRCRLKLRFITWILSVVYDPNDSAVQCSRKEIHNSFGFFVPCFIYPAEYCENKKVIKKERPTHDMTLVFLFFRHIEPTKSKEKSNFFFNRIIQVYSCTLHYNSYSSRHDYQLRADVRPTTSFLLDLSD